MGNCIIAASGKLVAKSVTSNIDHLQYIFFCIYMYMKLMLTVLVNVEFIIAMVLPCSFYLITSCMEFIETPL